MEFGYTEAPHKAFPVVFDSPRNRGLKDFPYKRILVGGRGQRVATVGACPAGPAAPSCLALVLQGLQRDTGAGLWRGGVRGRLGSSMWMKWKPPLFWEGRWSPPGAVNRRVSSGESKLPSGGHASLVTLTALARAPGPLLGNGVF